jgi:hypothetical protein
VTRPPASASRSPPSEHSIRASRRDACSADSETARGLEHERAGAREADRWALLAQLLEHDIPRFRKPILERAGVAAVAAQAAARAGPEVVLLGDRVPQKEASGPGTLLHARAGRSATVVDISPCEERCYVERSRFGPTPPLGPLGESSWGCSLCAPACR